MYRQVFQHLLRVSELCPEAVERGILPPPGCPSPSTPPRSGSSPSSLRSVCSSSPGRSRRVSSPRDPGQCRISHISEISPACFFYQQITPIIFLFQLEIQEETFCIRTCFWRTRTTSRIRIPCEPEDDSWTSAGSSGTQRRSVRPATCRGATRSPVRSPA